MGRSRLVLVCATLLYAASAEAQPTTFTRLFTGHLGAAHGGDIRDAAVTPGASVAVVDANGIGAELDAAHTRDFDTALFAESGITSVMLNVIALYPHPTVRPFVIAGVGALRTRAAIFEGQAPTSRTDIAFDAGAGAHYMINEVFGLRGDVRYFRYFQRHDDLPQLDNGFFDYWRTSLGVTVAWPIR